MNHNHVNYQRRLDLIHALLREQFNIENANITPIAYDAEHPFRYNNFVYRATLYLPIPSDGEACDKPRQPGCVAIPDGTTRFILRLTNSDVEGVNNTNRVDNEVAMISLVSAALSDLDRKVVPSVYAWGSAAAESSQGWILMELMPGGPVDAAFRRMELQGKKVILAQMAQMLAALQKFRLPGRITGLGRVTFDAAGRTVSAAMNSVNGALWPSYQTSFENRLKEALAKADGSPIIRGWRPNGLRERLEAFVESGLAAQFESLSSKEDKVLVHADFTTNNMHYDATSLRVTALVDYDWACISHPSFEFLRSFNGSGERLQGWSGDEDSEQLALTDAKLHGFPSPLPPSSANGVDWNVAKAWEDELEQAQVQRPRTIEGIGKVADVYAIVRTILPFRIANAELLRTQSEEVTMKWRDTYEGQLSKMLERLGF